MATCRRSGDVVRQCLRLWGRSTASHWQAATGNGPSTSTSTSTSTSRPFSSWLQNCTRTMHTTASLPNSTFSSSCSSCGLAAGALLRGVRGRALHQHGRGGLPGLWLAHSAASQWHGAHGALSASRRAMWSLSRSPSGMLGNFFAPGRRVTNTLVLIGVAMYLLEQRYPVVVPLLARINYLIDRGQYWRLVTSSFVHANFLHLLTNMLSLYWVGPMLEGVLGPRRFLVVYLGSAVTSNLLSYYKQPPNSMSVGASGSVCGILGGYVAYRFCNRHIMGFGGPELMWLGQIVGINLLLQMAMPGIDGWGHLGGALGGFALVFLMMGLRRRPPAYQQWRS